MKKTTILSWLIVCALLLVGCNSQYSPASTEPSPTEPMPTGSATGDAEPFIPSFMQDTQKPTETTPPQPQPEITWDQSKYKISLSSRPGAGNKGNLELVQFESCYEENHNANRPDTLTIDFLGKSYTGQFKCYTCYGSCDRAYYTYANPDYTFDFYVNERDELVGFHYLRLNDMFSEYKVISQESAISLAKDFIKNHFDLDIIHSSYQISRIYFYNSENSSDYTITFSRYIDEIAVSDSITVYLSNGEVSGFFSRSYKSVPDDIDISIIDIPEVNDVITQVMDYIYADIKETHYFENLSLNEKPDLITFLNDGTFQLSYSFSADIRSKSVPNFLVKESYSIIIDVLNNQ